MGCAVVKGAGKPKQPSTDAGPVSSEIVSDPPVVATTWATATYSSPSNAHASPVKSLDISPDDKNMVVSEVLSDDDEIEIIYEAAPKKAAPSREEQLERLQQQMYTPNPAANAQEPPQVAEESRASPQKESKPEVALSKSQQEEAAKLAERRKKFDNERYHQREQSGALGDSSGPVFHKPMDANVNQAFVQPAAMQAPKPVAAAATDNIMGLNQAQSNSEQSCGGLPGGINDDDMFLQPVAAKKKRRGHDDLEEIDADDEKMMTEILEDCEDF